MQRTCNSSRSGTGIEIITIANAFPVEMTLLNKVKSTS